MPQVPSYSWAQLKGAASLGRPREPGGPPGYLPSSGGTSGLGEQESNPGSRRPGFAGDAATKRLYFWGLLRTAPPPAPCCPIPCGRPPSHALLQEGRLSGDPPRTSRGQRGSGFARPLRARPEAAWQVPGLPGSARAAAEERGPRASAWRPAHLRAAKAAGRLSTPPSLGMAERGHSDRDILAGGGRGMPQFGFPVSLEKIKFRAGRTVFTRATSFLGAARALKVGVHQGPDANIWG